MLQALAADRSTRDVWWLHGTRNGREHAFAAEARELLAGLPNRHSRICYSSPIRAIAPTSISISADISMRPCLRG